MKRVAGIVAVVVVAAAVVGGVWHYQAGPDRGQVAPNPGPRVVWTYEAPQRGGFVAAPWVEGDTVFASAVLTHGLRQTGGVYAIDAATGRQRWAFLGGGAMRPVVSAPVLAGGRVYVGEGMHANFVCRLYCLDAATGLPHWTFEAGDHIESTPTVRDGTVFFAAGNDGVYALDAGTGAKAWQFAAEVHIDASPAVANSRVLVGSGPSRRFKTLQVLSLDARTGNPVWRVPVDLPAWGSPRVANGRVYVGLGNGRMTEPAKPPETPRGALLCLDEVTGRKLWTVPTGDAVFQQPTLAGGRVYFGSRDGFLYAADAETGTGVRRVAVGGPVIAPPAVDAGRVYVLSMSGMLTCLDEADFGVVWCFDIRDRTRAEVLAVGAPRVHDGKLYVAAELETGAGRTAILYCLQL